MYIFGAINLASALDIRVRGEGFLNEVVYPLLTLRVAFDRLDYETVPPCSEGTYSGCPR